MPDQAHMWRWGARLRRSCEGIKRQGTGALHDASARAWAVDTTDKSWSVPILWRLGSHQAVGLFLLCAVSLAAPVLGQSPAIHRLSPLGVPAGRTTEVKIVGERV